MMSTEIVNISGINSADILRFASIQIEGLTKNHPNAIPVFTKKGHWNIEEDAWAPAWTGGFLAGQMWIIAEATGDAVWRERAEHYSMLIEPRKSDRGTHDLGFLFTPSWSRWHRLAPSEQTGEVLVEAATSLASNFNEAGGYIRSWVDPGSTFIDIMMNVDLIFEAAEISGNERLSEIAYTHSQTSRRHLVRGDATTAHEGWFDPTTGEFLRHATHQGWRADSSWVRGHAWAIYGFTNAFIRTGDTDFLDTAKTLADTYILSAEKEVVPPNDWRDPTPEFPFEASAGSVLSAALLQLSQTIPTGDTHYSAAGIRLLDRLSTPPFLATDDPNWEGLIRKATYHRANNLGVQESNMWGDYYYLEAVERAKMLKLIN